VPRIQRIDIPQLVRVRKYEVDQKRLQNLLREQKKRSGKSNKTIAEALCVPVTKVEHWFRTDSCFAIPDADVWEQLKAELEITTPVFDEAIMTFEERPGVYEKSERCYFATGIAPTLTSTSAGNEKIIVGDSEMKVEIRKVTAAAMRSWPRTGSDDKNRVQRVEVSDREYANALTTVQKDSMAAEILENEPNVLRSVRTEYGKKIRKAYESGEVQESRHNMTELQPRTDGIANTLTTVQKDNYLHDGCLRIRKLTPKECFRLMGFEDSDFEKAEAVNSNSQLYKQAGNSIVVPVVQGILRNLLDCGVLEGEK
jgi:DNA (cytosine-5)-methyltransferase 1